MSKTYYVLYVQFEEGDKWTPEFGDYDCDAVEQEAEDNYNEVYNWKVAVLYDDQQQTIDEYTEQLNSEG